ncbi:MAG: hypothetical protein ABI439_03685 [Rhodospirillales bacterium]
MTRTAIFAAAICAVTPLPLHADEISRQQEAIRAPLRDKYVQAKQDEKDSAESRQAVLDRMSAMVIAGNEDLEEIRQVRTLNANTLVAKRTERRQAPQALSLALGKAGGKADSPEVIRAQAKLDALDAEIIVLEKRTAIFDQAERDKIALPASNADFDELLKASIELDKKRQETVEALRQANIELDKKRQQVIKTLALYLNELRPEPPPYLQSVQVYAGTKAMYRAEWRVDGKAADEATRELTERLDKIIADTGHAVFQMQQLRDELRGQRSDMFLSMKQYTAEINRAAADVLYAGQMVVLMPALIEATGVVLEVLLSGGASTAERHAVEEGVKAGTVLASALTKRSAGKVLTQLEQASITHAKLGKISDAEWLLVYTYITKKLPDFGLSLKAEAKDQNTSWRPADIIDRKLNPGSSDATKVLVADGAEQLLMRAGKAGATVLNYKAVAGFAAANGENLTKWQAVRSGAANFYGAKTPLKDIKDSFKGTRSANVLGLCITAIKTVVAAYYGAQLGDAEERLLQANAALYLVYHGYYVLLQGDEALSDEQRKMQEFHFQTFAYRLQTAGPRVLTVLTNEGNKDISETLTFALRFSQPLDKAPQVRIAGLVVEMKPQGADRKGRAAHWEGQLAANKLPDTLDEGVLEVTLADGSKPYAALDSNPVTAARFVVPDDLTKPLGDRQEWSDYERGSDRNHRIAFKAPKPQAPVPWRSQSTCARISCDCGAVGADSQRLCSSVEQQLREDCGKNGQTFGACPVSSSGPGAYPPPPSTTPITSPPGLPIAQPPAPPVILSPPVR